MPLSPDASTFVRALIHDMVNPMSSLVGFLEMLLAPEEKETLTHRQHRMLVSMDRASIHFLGMLRDISDLSKIEEGGWQPSPTPLNAHAVAARVFSGYEILAKNRHITLTVKAPSEPLILSADEYMLERFLDALLRAAGRLTPEKGRILLTLRQEGAGMEGVMEHTGEPLSAPSYAAAFAASLTGPRPGEGYALMGLALARHISLMHGGTVEARRSAGGGAFHFRFP